MRENTPRRSFVTAATGLAAALLAAAAAADVTLPSVLGNNMVVQRDRPVRVWGWAAPAEKVHVAFADRQADAVADAQGAWRVELPACPAGTAGTLTVSGANTLTLTNVVAGDVWVCSGQSNMEMLLGSTRVTNNEVVAFNQPAIRRLRTGRDSAARPLDRLQLPARWDVCTPTTAAAFTAAGFHFAVAVHEASGVPVGLLDCSWGGSAIEPYLPPSAAGATPELNVLRTNLEAAVADYRVNLPKRLDAWERWVTDARAALAAAGEIPPTPPSPQSPAADAGRLSAKYNAMVHPLTGLPVRGFLWYQGEANGSEGDTYRTKLRALIESWRAAWGQGDLPFYVVQLANFQAVSTSPAGGDGWARLREAQAKACREVPLTGLATIIDIGEAGDIHPKNKYDVGRRLARWALRDVYGQKDLEVSGPVFREMQAADGGLRLRFDHVGKGLIVGRKAGHAPVAEMPDGKLQRFAVAGDDKAWHWADARLEGDSVFVSSPEVPSPVAVRYAFAMNPEGANLYNRDGLPAVPFRSDDW